MGESKRTCPICQRPPRGIHASTCSRARPGYGARLTAILAEVLEKAAAEQERRAQVVDEAVAELRAKEVRDAS